MGDGVAEFAHEICGHVEVDLLNVSGEIIEQKVVEYDTSKWYHESPTRTSYENRFVSFSVKIPIATAVASVSVRHQSTGGCEHSWSLQLVLNWLVDKMFFSKKAEP
jgi:hypothetical protein